MQAVLDRLLRGFIVWGTLEVRWPDGTMSRYSGADRPRAGMALRDAATVRRVTLNPGLAIGEAYMNGTLVPIDCSLYELLDVLTGNLARGGRHPAIVLRDRVRRWTTRWTTRNPAGRARRNAAHHYDLNGRLYSLFLDRDRQYSCAYFARGDETLEEAQLAKKRHIAAKLKLDRPDLSVLDIGCGWGGMALTLAQEFGARVLGITLSAEQLVEARARAAAAGLAGRVRFELMDYRAVEERFDRIVSVGMFEHVGTAQYGAFFRTIERCLAPDGVALLHSIGRSEPPGGTNPWLAKYIFPGGYTPALSEVLADVERSGLWVTDIEILRLHYAHTLRHWRRRFAANRDAIGTIFDERFCRMWEFYLAGAELSFRNGGQMNFQMQLARAVDALPITRDYIAEAERSAKQRRDPVQGIGASQERGD